MNTITNLLSSGLKPDKKIETKNIKNKIPRNATKVAIERMKNLMNKSISRASSKLHLLAKSESQCIVRKVTKYWDYYRKKAEQNNYWSI